MRRFPKKVFYALLLILVWLSFIVQGSHALLSDQAVLADNVIRSGSVDLKVSNSQEYSTSDYADSQPGFTFTLLPGSSDQRYFFLINKTEAPVPLDIAFMPVPKNPLPEEISKNIRLEIMMAGPEGNSNGTMVQGTLADLSAAYTKLNLSLGSGFSQRFIVKATMLPEFAQSNANVPLDLVFVGTQRLAS